MKPITNLMISQYHLKNYDMLGFKLTRDNATYHHIFPLRKGGQETILNGAILSIEAHQRFNKLEEMYPELAEELNDYMYLYKGFYPLEVWNKIEQLMSIMSYKKVNHIHNKKQINYKRKRIKKRR